MIAEFILASLLLLGGTTSRSLSFTDVTSLEDTIVEAADGNVDMSHDNMK